MEENIEKQTPHTFPDSPGELSTDKNTKPVGTFSFFSKTFLIGLLIIVIAVFLLTSLYILRKAKTHLVSSQSANTIVSSNPNALTLNFQKATDSAYSSSIANWKTYTNATYSYSFKYPPQWFVIDEINQSSTTDVSNIIYLNDTPTLKNGNYQVSIMPTNNDLQKSKFFLNYGDAGLQNSAGNILSFTVDSHPAYKAVVTTSEYNHTTGTTDVTGRFYKVLIELSKNNTLSFESKTEQQSLVDQILSTFKFTD